MKKWRMYFSTKLKWWGAAAQLGGVGLGVGGKTKSFSSYQDEIVGASRDLGCLVVVVDDITAGRCPRQRRHREQRQDRRGGHLLSLSQTTPKSKNKRPASNLAGNGRGWRRRTTDGDRGIAESPPAPPSAPSSVWDSGVVVGWVDSLSFFWVGSGSTVSVLFTPTSASLILISCFYQ